MPFKLPYLALIFPALLASCASGGSLDTEDTTPKVINNKPTLNESGNNQSHDDTSDKKVPEEELDEFNKPSVGFVAEIVRPDLPHITRNSLMFLMFGRGKYESEYKSVPITLNYLNGDTDNIDSIENSLSHGVGGVTFDKRKTNPLNFQYINSGFITKSIYERNYIRNEDGTYKLNIGPEGHIFYKGTNPSSSLPNSPTEITYKGSWDYISDTQQDRNKFSDVSHLYNSRNYMNAGQVFSAYSGIEKNLNVDNEDFPMGLTSEFHVNFANKKLTGKLTANKYVHKDNPQEIEERYTLEADIYGNRFRGTTTANKEGKDENALFIKDGILEGGFFGPKAEELAGKFLANDKSLVGVFGAKRDDTELATEQILDAFVMPKDGEETQALNNFGNATKLYLDGQEVNLIADGQDLNKVDIFGDGSDAQNGVNVRSCCSNLDYLKYGQLDKAGENFVFLQGERTPTANIPTTGNAEYQGSWSGYIGGFPFDGKGKNDGQQANSSHFKVEFDSKRIEGQLFDGLGNKAVDISADIAGNTFKGNAHIDNYQLDPKAESGASQVSFSKEQLKVNGAFYGNTASELGGAVVGKNTDNKHTNIVFGAKKQLKGAK